MKKKRKKSDRQVLKELFPPEIVREVDTIIEEVDGKKKPRYKNPFKKGDRAVKPWSKSWTGDKP